MKGEVFLKRYVYKAPMIKTSSELVDVRNEKNEVILRFNRLYKNLFIKFIDLFFLGGDSFVQFDTYSVRGELKYRGMKKLSKMGKTEYYIENYKDNSTYHITYTSLQIVAPELLIKSATEEYVVKHIPMDWAKFYYKGKEVARWRMKTTELFKTYLEIDEDSPIQDPAFFICLFQCVLYVG
ncbi:tubby C-terminal domain-like protein [Bacillus rhizoplanae]|uniref:tubby C-terminal domain-like protein n=1 Tax=Bacillus rhizoplanae TaxID=2880966 RepID=UPI003D222D62